MSSQHTPPQGEKREYDEAVEAIRRAVCALQRHSFLLDPKGNVRCVADRSGRWIDFQAVHELFDTEAIEGLIAKERANAALAKAAGNAR